MPVGCFRIDSSLALLEVNDFTPTMNVMTHLITDMYLYSIIWSCNNSTSPQYLMIKKNYAGYEWVCTTMFLEDTTYPSSALTKVGTKIRDTFIWLQYHLIIWSDMHNLIIYQCIPYFRSTTKYWEAKYMKIPFKSIHSRFPQLHISKHMRTLLLYIICAGYAIALNISINIYIYTSFIPQGCSLAL